jgi:hypothetical protein
MRTLTARRRDDDGPSRDWSIRTTRQRHERGGAVAAGITGILSIGISLSVLLAAGGLGLGAVERAGVLLGGVVAVVVLAVGTIATESLARHRHLEACVTPLPGARERVACPSADDGGGRRGWDDDLHPRSAT